MATGEATWDQRILARLPPSVDSTLIAESLRLTPTERLTRLQEMLAFVETTRRVSGYAVPQPPRHASHG